MSIMSSKIPSPDSGETTFSFFHFCSWIVISNPLYWYSPLLCFMTHLWSYAHPLNVLIQLIQPIQLISSGHDTMPWYCLNPNCIFILKLYRKWNLNDSLNELILVSIQGEGYTHTVTISISERTVVLIVKTYFWTPCGSPCQSPCLPPFLGHGLQDY